MQSWIGEALYYAKPMLRVSPYFFNFSSIQIISLSYFHEPAIFKSLPGEMHPILLIQELQAIKFQQDNINYIKQVKSIKLLRDDCHKQAVLIFESHSDLNWCTPAGENLANTPHTFHAQSVYGVRPYISHVVHI
jgi:hypothetical protein